MLVVLGAKYNGLGEVYRRTDRPNEALAAYTTAYELTRLDSDPVVGIVKLNMTATMLALGRYEQA